MNMTDITENSDQNSKKRDLIGPRRSCQQIERKKP